LTLAEFLAQLTRITYIVIGLVTLFDWLVHRDRARLDMALLFNALAAIIFIQEYTIFTGQTPYWLGKFSQLALMAHPYLLLRVVEHFRPVPRAVRWVGILGLLASWAVLLLLPTTPTAVNLFLVLYFVLVELYAVVALLLGAWTTRGVTRWRLGLAAVGSGLIASIFIIVGIVIIVPSLQPYISLLNQLFAVFSGVSYYLGFAPPRWLLRAWQLPELYDFLQEAAGKPVEERGQETLTHLCKTAVRAVGGRAAVAAMWDASQQQLIIQGTTNPALLGNVSTTQGVTGKAWQTRQPAFVRSPADFSPESRRLAGILEAHSLIAVPIRTADRVWGLLVVLLQRAPLFPNDDMALLTLFTEQSALTLEQWELFNQQKALLNEQQKLVADLKERTNQLEESNRELEAFSYSVSHDLRAPLRHIEGFTEFLVKAGVAEKDEKSKRHLTLITEAARRMGILIDNLLTFSRLGRAALTVTPVDLAGVVEDARHDLQVETDGRNINWQVDALPRVYGDAALLRLVLVNLLANALKYTRGRTQAKIHIGCQNDQPETATIFVRDNGVGFDMQYADKLFGVFQRLHHADEFEGTGIGLANVRRIITRHGGRTWAEGALDEGATFYFSLPLGPSLTASSPFSGQPGLPPPFPFAVAALASRGPDQAVNHLPS
jgi:signal transduction histidine kinase